MKHDEPEQAMARNREKGERPRTPRTARCTGRLVLVGMICVWMTVGCAPKGKIASDSKTEACRAELAGALQTLSSDYGLAYSVDPTDADSIFSTGVVKKSYGRDGIVPDASSAWMSPQTGARSSSSRRPLRNLVTGPRRPATTVRCN